MTGMHTELDDVQGQGPEYDVVVNDEEQYSVWRSDRRPPAGWRTTGFQGPRAACLDHIASVWTDLRPRTLREREAR